MDMLQTTLMQQTTSNKYCDWSSRTSEAKKLRAGNRASSRHWCVMCRLSYFCLLDIPGLCNITFFIIKCGIVRFLCIMHVFDILTP